MNAGDTAGTSSSGGEKPRGKRGRCSNLSMYMLASASVMTIKLASAASMEGFSWSLKAVRDSSRILAASGNMWHSMKCVPRLSSHDASSKYLCKVLQKCNEGTVRSTCATRGRRRSEAGVVREMETKKRSARWRANRGKRKVKAFLVLRSK